MKYHLLIVLVLFTLLTVSLSGCRLFPAPASNNGNTPGQGGPVVRGETLPGRLLFVQQGVIWQWREGEGRPLLGKGLERHPDWSPDGTKITYVEHGESYTDVMIADAKGDHLAQLTYNGSEHQLQSRERIHDTMWAFYPTWMPDGSRITVASQYGPPYGSPAVEYNLSLFLLSTDGSGKRQQIYADTMAQCGSMDYLPTTAEREETPILAFTHAGMGAEGYQQIYRLDLETETAAPFPGMPRHSYDPAFSPDGAWLAFAARNGNETDIWVLPGEPTARSEPNPTQLTSLGRARAPAFSPDGTMLAFLAIPPGKGGFELWVVPLSESDDGTLRAGKPRQISCDMNLDADSGLSWAP